MSLKSELAELVQRGRVALVLGTGTTMQTTGRHDLTWDGLIRRGLDRVREVGDSKSAAWFELVQNEITLGIETSDTDLLIAAAGKVQQGLGGNGSGSFAEWLRIEFENLEPESTELLQAVGKMDVPILTTNYDDLSEVCLQRASVSWRETSAIEQIVAGRSRNIGHLHGIWRDPESVIFGAASYGALLERSDAQHLQRALATTRSLVFVGCGSGLDDPNVGGLMRWLELAVPNSEIFHYRLCLNSEIGDATASSTVRAVGFGETHDDLAFFLRDLVPSPIELLDGDTSEHRTQLENAGRAAAALLEQARTETILSDHVVDLDKAGFAELTVPPVILPVTQQQYVDSQDLPKAQRIKRCELGDEVQSGRRILLAADERSGLTTALKWLVHRHYENDRTVIPIYIDFRALGKGHIPLRRKLVRELAAAGHIQSPDDPLPPIALALDNVLDRPEKIFERVSEELTDDAIRYLVIGVRQGAESSVQPALLPILPDLSLRYIGRMNQGDIRSLAALVSPGRANGLTTKTIAIVSQEHLPRTPFTIGLLLSALLQGQALLATSSETALLDAYITLLLGGGDPHDDARFTLDAYERGQLLAVLASAFVREDSGSMSLDNVAKTLRGFFDAVDWSENPLDVINNLRSRHVIKQADGNIHFSQASYLHLFAARAAITDTQLRDHLFERPLYYSSIIKHYAALNRGDATALERVASLLGNPEQSSETGARSSGFFAVRQGTDRVLDSQSVDELLESLNLDPPQLTDDAPEDEVLHEVDPLDRMNDEDLDPFPVDRVEDANASVQVLTALSLVSNVLRDSEMVTDLDLKTTVLARTLSVWGKLVTLLEDDEDFTSFVTDISERLAEEGGLSEEKAKKYQAGFIATAPTLVGLSGMQTTLATRKLIRSIERVFALEDFDTDALGSVMGALLAFGIEGANWPAHFQQVQAKHPRLRAVDSVMFGLAIAAYYFHNRLDGDSAHRLEDFIGDQYLSRINVAEDRQKKRVKGEVRQRLRTNRALRSRDRLSAGENVLENPQPFEIEELDA